MRARDALSRSVRTDLRLCQRPWRVVLDDRPGAARRRAHEAPQVTCGFDARRRRAPAGSRVGRASPCRWSGAGRTRSRRSARREPREEVVAHQVLRERRHARVPPGHPLADRAVLGLALLADADVRVGVALDAELGQVEADALATGARWRPRSSAFVSRDERRRSSRRRGSAAAQATGRCRSCTGGAPSRRLGLPQLPGALVARVQAQRAAEERSGGTALPLRSAARSRRSAAGRRRCRSA